MARKLVGTAYREDKVTKLYLRGSALEKVCWCTFGLYHEREMCAHAVILAHDLLNSGDLCIDEKDGFFVPVFEDVPW